MHVSDHKQRCNQHIYDNNTPAYTTNIIILSNYDYVESLRICFLYIKSWHMPYTLLIMKELLMFYTLVWRLALIVPYFHKTISSHRSNPLRIRMQISSRATFEMVSFDLG